MQKCGLNQLMMQFMPLLVHADSGDVFKTSAHMRHASVLDCWDPQMHAVFFARAGAL